MAFFSSNYAYDSQLRRKRSTSRDRPSRPSTGDKSIDEISLRKRSPSTSSPSVMTPESREPMPPLPTPVSAGLSRSRIAASPDAPDMSSAPYDPSSTPIPFTKPVKRISPPPFSNLMINVPTTNPDPIESRQPTSSSRTPSESPSRRHASISSKKITYSALQADASSTGDLRKRSDEAASVSHSAMSLGDSETVLFHVTSADLERRTPLPSQSTAAVSPVKSQGSPDPERNLDTQPTTLPTPVSPPTKGLKTARLEQIGPLPPGPSHSRSLSASNSPTAYASGSGPGSTKHSGKRQSPPLFDKGTAVAAPGSGSASGSGKSTPTGDTATGKQSEKRPRKVLRKRSVTGSNRQHEPASTHTSDSEKKTNTHRPRSRSAVFSSFRRNSIGAIFDISQPLPTKPMTSVDHLTPAGEILVAYKQSQRENLTLGTSGKVVAAGSEEDGLNIPWTSGWRTGRPADEASADERDARDKRVAGLRSGLRRKLSAKWNAKEHDGRNDGRTGRSASGSVTELSGRLTREMGTQRSTTLPKDVHIGASPRSGGNSVQRSGWPNDGEGRVWEEDVGDWLGKHLRDNDREDAEASNSHRLWKLVKRFSSGNLKEKRSPPLALPPPVPPLPQDLSRKRPEAGVRDEEDLDAGEILIPRSAVPESPGGIMRYITSVPLLSIPRSRSVGGGTPANSHRRPDPDSIASPTPSRTSFGRRPSTAVGSSKTGRSTTTRSSSPSSETTKFFSRSRSSSSSSYGDAQAPPVPSVPAAHVARYIVHPRELYGIHTERDGDNPSVGRQTSSKVAATPVITQSPRKASPSGSATIPLFEAKHAVNNFSPYKRKGNVVPPPSPTSHFPDSEPITPHVEWSKPSNPPPIPQRNPRRPGHQAGSVPSLPMPTQERSEPDVIPVQYSSESEVTDGDVPRLLRRPSLGETSKTHKARPRSISDGAIIPEPELYSSAAKSTLRFREMTTAQRQLTEQEKNAKWEDLLQRSDKAGGTLHVGSPTPGGLGLWSDRTSLALSETLDRY